jgi:hypothetical protein
MPHACFRLAILLLIMLTTGCAHSKTATRDVGNRPPIAGARVLLMPATIELYELTAGGLLEPKAEWTTSARAHVVAALKEELGKRNAALVPYRSARNDPSKYAAHTQLVKLHDIVGTAILTHHFALGPSLPTKQGGFDWTLGQGVRMLYADYGADYGLFILIRDSYASNSRKATAALQSAMSSYPVSPGGQQTGFASLVDLRTGDILWFNWLKRGTGDLREGDTARDTVRELLTDFPA